jgi:hypothetical protein
MGDLDIDVNIVLKSILLSEFSWLDICFGNEKRRPHKGRTLLEKCVFKC